MRRIGRLTVSLTILASAACGGPDRLTPNTYIRSVQTLTSAQRAAQAEREIAAVIPNPDQRYAFSNGVWSSMLGSSSPVFHGDQRSLDLRPVDSLRQGGTMNVTVQFNMRPGVPIYRVILDPLDFDPAAMDNWREYVVLDTGLNRDEGTDEQITAPLAGAERTPDGRLITQWVYCGSCLADGPPEGDDAQLLRLRRYAQQYGSYQASSSWPTAWGYRRLFFTTSAPADLVAGAQAVQTAQAIAQDGIEAAEMRTARAAQNEAYASFFRNVYNPLTFEAYAARSDCPQEYSGFYPMGNVAATHADDAREAERYARCHADLIETYDLEQYTRRYPELVAQEEALWAQTSGVERREILTPQAQIDLAMERIAVAYDNADRSWSRSDRIAANNAERQREVARNRQIYLQTQAQIESWQREVAGNTPIVSADGRITTANAERERAQTAARMAALRTRAERPGNDGPSSGSSSSASGSRETASLQLPSGGGTTTGAPTAEPELPPTLPGASYYAMMGLENFDEGHVWPICPWPMPGDRSRSECVVLHHTHIASIFAYCIPNRGTEAYTVGETITTVAIRGITTEQSEWFEQLASSKPYEAYGAMNWVDREIVSVLEADRNNQGRQVFFDSTLSLMEAHRDHCPEMEVFWDGQ